MSARSAMPYTHFDYMYFLSTHASIVGKKMVLLDCCNLEKCFNRSSLKLVSTCSSLILKFDATLFFDEWTCAFVCFLSKDLSALAKLRVLQTFVDSYGPKRNIVFPWKVTKIVWGGGSISRFFFSNCVYVLVHIWCIFGSIYTLPKCTNT